MADSYIPTQEAAAEEWMVAYSGGITANPALYGLTAADALGIQNAVDAFVAARLLTTNPSTKTEVTVAAKDDARTAAEQICRQFAVLIKYDNGISDADKIAIGVRPVNSTREPIGAPTTSPLLSIVGASPGSQTLRYSDTSTPDSAAKPFGVTGLQLFVAVGETPIADPDDASFYGVFTKNPVGVGFSAAENGKQATYFARWATAKGLVGPWSLPQSMAIAA